MSNLDKIIERLTPDEREELSDHIANIVLTMALAANLLEGRKETVVTVDDVISQLREEVTGVTGAWEREAGGNG